MTWIIEPNPPGWHLVQKTAHVTVCADVHTVSPRHVRVEFMCGEHDHYARAETGRLYAQVCDTIADLALDNEREGQPPLDATVTVGTSSVLVTGADAMVCVAPFFGDEFCERAFG